MTGLFYISMVLLVVCFIAWQFKMLRKYTLSYDKLTVDLQNRVLTINGHPVSFDDISFITVQVKQQPSLVERSLSKSAAYVYMAEMLLHLHNGETVGCNFNHKGALYQTLKKLEPFVPVQANIDNYKPQIAWVRLILIVTAIIVILMSARH